MLKCLLHLNRQAFLDFSFFNFKDVFCVCMDTSCTIHSFLSSLTPPSPRSHLPLLAHTSVSSLTPPSPRSHLPLHTTPPSPLSHLPLLAHTSLSSLTPPSPLSHLPLLAHTSLSSLTPPSPRSHLPVSSHSSCDLRTCPPAYQMRMFHCTLTRTQQQQSTAYPEEGARQRRSSH